jgi:hypothetical protein
MARSVGGSAKRHAPQPISTQSLSSACLWVARFRAVQPRRAIRPSQHCRPHQTARGSPSASRRATRLALQPLRMQQLSARSLRTTEAGRPHARLCARRMRSTRLTHRTSSVRRMAREEAADSAAPAVCATRQCHPGQRGDTTRPPLCRQTSQPLRPAPHQAPVPPALLVRPPLAPVLPQRVCCRSPLR